MCLRVSINMSVKQRVLVNKESLWDVSERRRWLIDAICRLRLVKKHSGVEENLFSLLRILRWVWCPFLRKAWISALRRTSESVVNGPEVFKRSLPRGIIGRRCPRAERGNERGSETLDLLRKVINVSFSLADDSPAQAFDEWAKTRRSPSRPS